MLMGNWELLMLRPLETFGVVVALMDGWIDE
jgi:hypothetical protein